MKTPLTIGLILSLCLLVMWDASANAQNPLTEATGTSEPASQDTTPAEPQWIPASELPLRSQQATTRLQEIEIEIRPRPKVEEIEVELPKVRSGIDSWQAEIRRRLDERESLLELQETVSEWDRRRSRLDSWQSELQSRSKRLEELRVEVAEIKKTWEITKQHAAEAEYPDAIRERIDEILSRADEIDQGIRDRVTTVLTLQDSISQELIDVRELLGDIELAFRKAEENLLSVDSPPLWQVLERDTTRLPLLTQIRESWRSRLHALEEFAEGREDDFPLTATIAGVLFLLFLVLGQYAKRWDRDDPEIQGAIHVLGKPLSSAVLVSIAVTIWSLRNPPIVVAELLELILLFPFLRLLPGLIRPSMRRPLYLFVGVMALEQLRSLATQQSFLERILLLAVAVAATALLLYVHRLAPRSGEPRVGVARDLAVLIFRITIAVMVLSIIANVVGNATLARFLVKETIEAIYSGFLLFAAVQVIRGLLAVVLRTPLFLQLRMVRSHAALIQRRLTGIVKWLAIIGWAYAFLLSFRLWPYVSRDLWQFITREWQLGAIQISIGSVLLFGLIAYAAVQISRILQFVVGEDVLPRLQLPRGVPAAITRVTSMVIVGFGFVLAAAAAGVEFDKLALITGALGVGIGFGLQNLVNNFVSGIILIFERPIQVGDTVTVGTMLGNVKRIGIRSSTVRTFDGAEVIVPNGNLISSEVTNWTLSDRQRRIEIPVGVKYGTDPDRVLEILVRECKKHPDTLEQPAPYALFDGFGDSSLNFIVRFYTNNYDNWIFARSEVTVAINNALKEEGIEIPFPQRDLHVRSIEADLQERFAGKPPDEPKPRTNPEDE